MQGVHEDCGFVVGIVVNGGGRQGTTGDGRGLWETAGYRGNCRGREGTGGDRR